MRGSSSEKTCLPVQSGFGLRMAGVGSWPSSSSPRTSIHMLRFIRSSWLMKVSRRVSSMQPSSESCTRPMVGLFDCGFISCCGTSMSSLISAIVS